MNRRDPELEAREMTWDALRSLTVSQRHRVLRWAVQEFLPTKKMLASVDGVAEAFRRGFNTGRDYTLWADRSSDEATRPDTRNPFDGRDETDPDGSAV
ncbi:hypothetical protein ACQP1O_43010 (plasmid) [Nocardia sp. CA-151230]|uniref:hypothetical protein n=1 Tax=Nocardia sp. CA-151230 TaxID=3239982 RepID=UPI003D906E3E